MVTDKPRKSFNQEKVIKCAQCCQEIKEEQRRASLMVPELRLHTPNAGSLRSIPGQGTGSLRLQLRPGIEEEETFKRAILGRSHFRSKESLHFISLDLSEHGEQKQGEQLHREI